jgi:hypothetical protein
MSRVYEIFAVIALSAALILIAAAPGAGQSLPAEPSSADANEVLQVETRSGNGTDDMRTRNQPPVLQNGYVNPEEGDQGEQFDFDVEFTDPDGDPPDWVRVYIDGVSHTMSVISGLEWWHRYSTSDLEAGTHEFYFRAADPSGATARFPATGSISGPVVFASCNGMLRNGYVNPEDGDLTTEFDFDVEFYDPDGTGPVWVKVFIDGSSHYMEMIEGLPYWYRYTTTLGYGDHEFHFTAIDPDDCTYRFPPTGEIDGPVVPVYCAGQLINGFVDPEQALYDDQFEFFVEYDHPLEWEPEQVRVVIDGTESCAMTYAPGSTYWYEYMTPLEPGPHYYHFEADDAEGCFYRQPETGEFLGPACVLDQQKLCLDPVEGHILYYTDNDDDGWHDPEEPYYDGDHPLSNDWNGDNSCWMASAANLLTCEGLSNPYETWLGTGGAPSPVTRPWGETSYAPGGGGARTFDDGGFQNYCLSHAGESFIGPIISDDEFGVGEWSSNPVNWCSARLGEGYPVGLAAFWGSPARGADPGWMSDDRQDGYHAITLWGIDAESGMLVITDSDDLTPADDDHLGPRLVSYVYSSRDWLIPSLYDGIDAHVNYAVAFAPTVNNDPILTECIVEPPSGTASTEFYYSAHYFDEDGDAPSLIQVTIDGTAYAMVLSDGGTPHDGEYTHGPVYLLEGSHAYYIYCEDGNGGSARCPGTGAYEGPEVGDCPSFQDITSGPVGDSADGNGASWGDCDGDGDLDLFLSNHNSADRFFENDGLCGLTDATVSPLGNTGYGRGPTWGDYDNDGDLDLYLARGLSGNLLYRNDGSCLFSVASGSGAEDTGNAKSSAWVDVDNDGWIDIYVGNAGDNGLYRNNRDGTFSSVDDPLFVDAGQTMGMAWADYDNDGNQDVYLSNTGSSNKLLRNLGDWLFEDATSAPLDDSSDGRGAAWADYDNDGDLDLYLANIGGNRLFRNEGDGSFSDATTPVLEGLASSLGVAWGDYDNDGDLDLYVANSDAANVLLENQGDGTFIDATRGPLGDTSTSRTGVWGDCDGDGALDLYIVNQGANKLLKNSGCSENNWLRVDLVGGLTNMSAIGARVEVYTGRGVQIRELNGGMGFRSQDPLCLQFGVGSASSVDSVVVRWPATGVVDRYTNVTPGQTLMAPETIVGIDDGLDSAPLAFTSSNYPNPFNPSTVIAYELRMGGRVSLRVYDTSGRLVRELLRDRPQRPGAYTVPWNGTDDRGQAVASGAYFYRLEAGGEELTRKMILLR